MLRNEIMLKEMFSDQRNIQGTLRVEMRKLIVSTWLKLLARSQSYKFYCSDKQDFSVFFNVKEIAATV